MRFRFITGKKLPIRKDCENPYVASDFSFTPLPVKNGEDYVCLSFLSSKHRVCNIKIWWKWLTIGYAYLGYIIEDSTYHPYTFEFPCVTVMNGEDYVCLSFLSSKHRV
ncbi:hypothetical protein F2Q68_00041338 [Brassica cretica]|uniref:Uncharacterized protein n=1 Tax=Brassica cretica TaxID=69181 RepID=A0A8S9MPC7_BRACR|nr:hypothetical protein F2Q68_00041338 [Brassica cretica]